MKKAKHGLEAAAEMVSQKRKARTLPQPTEGSAKEESGESAKEETLEDQLCPTCHQKVLEHFGKQRMKHA